MELTDIIRIGASLIQNNSDSATTGLDMGDIVAALSKLLSDSDGGFDLGSLASSISSDDLGNIVSSWVGSGENMPISIDQITELIGSEKITDFASQLGLSEESAAIAIGDALPTVVDDATTADQSLASAMLEQVGGAEGAMKILSKLFS